MTYKEAIAKIEYIINNAEFFGDEVDIDEIKEVIDSIDQDAVD